MNEKQSYLNQIEQFYNGNLKSNQVIQIGKTPECLTRLGAKQLPIVLKQSTLAKCIREPKGSRSAHNLNRVIIEALHTQISEPILVVNEKQRNSFALITDYKDQNENNILIAMKLESTVNNMSVNEIVSFYGRNNLKIYLDKHNAADIHIIDNKKAKSLASLLRLQLPTTLQVFDYKNKIPFQTEDVNKKFSVLKKLKKLDTYKKEISIRDSSGEHKHKEHPREER